MIFKARLDLLKLTLMHVWTIAGDEQLKESKFFDIYKIFKEQAISFVWFFSLPHHENLLGCIPKGVTSIEMWLQLDATSQRFSQSMWQTAFKNDTSILHVEPEALKYKSWANPHCPLLCDLSKAREKLTTSV